MLPRQSIIFEKMSGRKMSYRDACYRDIEASERRKEEMKRHLAVIRHG
jgi:hypothetical protein